MRHVFNGGWSTDFGPNAEIGLSPDGLLRIPFMVEAKNLLFEFDGGPHKMGGAAKLNSSAINSGDEIRGLVDYWKVGVGGTPSQKFIAHTGTILVESDGDDTFTTVSGGTGLTDNAVPNYASFDDLLIIGSEASGDVPMSYDQTTLDTTMGTNTPNFSFSEPHKNRLWAAGVPGAPSLLFYSPALTASGPAGDWDGVTSGSIEIDPGDGDKITAIASHKNELWVFKGPYKGSIHRITGSAPTGGDAFARTTFIRGIGAVHQNTIFRFRDDLGFMWSDGSVRSLNATAAFGDFIEAALSRPIRNFLLRNVVFSRLNQSWAATLENLDCVLFTVPINTATFPNAVLCMDYRFEPVRWSYLEALGENNAAVCVARMVDTTAQNQAIGMSGGNDGFIRKLFREDRNIDGSIAYTMRALSPFMNYGDPFVMKTIHSAGIGVRSGGTGEITFGWQGDQKGQQTQTVTMVGGVLLDDGSDTGFLLDTDFLGGNVFQDRFLSLETGGEFREIQYEVRNGNVDEDLDITTISTKMTFGPESLEN
jgi:hypothetical protein